ncbi:MAG: hypothetical protein NBV67_04070 [Tagaea sp.]|nr:hypothetical protein [Tagaea sp.]
MRLRYAEYRHRFEPGEGFALGDDYRLAHLPLIDPGHRRAISRAPGKDYVDGRYASPRHALVLHVPAEALDASPVFRSIEAALKSSAVGPKIAWATHAKRRDVLHATLAGPVDEATARTYEARARDFPTTPVPVRLGGPFIGNRNHGRVYLPVYPAAGDPLAALQRAIGARETGFYAVGLWHLSDDLDPAEAAALAAWRDRWENETVLAIAAARFGILTTTDDQAIHSPQWRWIDSEGL